MRVDRREFLLQAAAMAAVVPPPVRQTGAVAQWRPETPSLGDGARGDFPIVESQIYLNSAAQHPLGLPVLHAMERQLDYDVYGEGEERVNFGWEDQQSLKQEFGELINAGGDEIAFVQSTSDGENIVVAGMDLVRRGGNVVVDDLHFTTSLVMYKSLEAHGLELRVVKQRNGAIPLESMQRAIDSETRLVSMALVSNVNGYLHDVAGVSALAHAHGAWVYADLIQAAGAVPLDVKAMGIDFGAASTYKWLMAARGFGLLYVKRELQGEVVATTRWGHRQVKGFDREALTWEPQPGATRYETGNISGLLAAGALAGIRYVRAIGVEAISAHAAGLVGRLQDELPRIGYAPLTPAGNATPIVAFVAPDAEATMARLQAAGIVTTVVPPESRLRVSVSVFNTDRDVDRLIRALA